MIFEVLSCKGTLYLARLSTRLVPVVAIPSEPGPTVEDFVVTR